MRGGLLGQGSVLTVTSYANRTSPGASRQVDPREHRRNAAAAAAAERAAAEGHGRRGASALDAGAHGAASRQSRLRRLPSADGSGRPLDGELRRHRPMADPHGVGQRRRCLGRAARRIDVQRHDRPAPALLRKPELFVGTLTEKLLTYALGRGLEYYDAPAVRAIVASARTERLSVLVARARHRLERSVSDEDVAMIVTKTALPRRTFLRGLGTALSLPLLDAMVPALSPRARRQPRARSGAWATSTSRWA